MTKDELMKYYEDNKNTQHEIKLRGHNTGVIYTFRHYLEFGTGDDKWLNLITGTLLTTTHLLKYYKIPCNTFTTTSDVYNYIKQNINIDNSVIFDNDFGEPIRFRVYDSISSLTQFLISELNDKVYTLFDIIYCKYTPHRED